VFITFEGPDGSGKTTQMAELVQFLTSQGFDVFSTREPGGTSIGNQIRQVLFDHANTAMHPHTEILLFLASRSQLVAQEILPRLEKGQLVLCDRYRDSTLAYQGYGHGVDLTLLRTLNSFATQELKPDLTFLLAVDAETGLQRRATEGGWNRLDAYQLAFHQRVSAGYNELARSEPARWVVMDANRPAERVQNEIRTVVLEHLKKLELNKKKPRFGG